MDNLREQIFQATDNFLTSLRQLAHRHTEQIFQETFSSLGTKQPASAVGKPRGAKRGADELDQLSQRFAQFVHANPGLRIEQINKELGTTTAALALPIRKLVASGAVSAKGAKRSTTYFAGKTTAASAAGTDKKAPGPAGTPAPPTAGKSHKKRASARGRSGRSGSKSRSRSRSKSKSA